MIKDHVLVFFLNEMFVKDQYRLLIFVFFAKIMITFQSFCKYMVIYDGYFYNSIFNVVRLFNASGTSFNFNREMLHQTK